MPDAHPRGRTAGLASSLGMLLLLAGSPRVQAAKQTAANCPAGAIKEAIDKVVNAGGGTVRLRAFQDDNTWTSDDFVEVPTDMPLRLKGAGMDLPVIGYEDGATPAGGCILRSDTEPALCFSSVCVLALCFRGWSRSHRSAIAPCSPRT